MAGLKTQLWLRCNGYCERCGIPLGDSWAMHHRKLKSRGGKDEITNVVALDHHCHNLGTGSVHLDPARATLDGFLVASWDDPANIPIKTPDNVLKLLLIDGTYERTDDSGFLGDND